jgi:hypothetical protein
MNKTLLRSIREDVRLAQAKWGPLARPVLSGLRGLAEKYGLSIAMGDLQLLDGSWYVSHSGLLRLARRSRCSAIRTQPVIEFCDASLGRWVFIATVFKSPSSKGFVGYGDADPSNVSPLVRGAEMRVAETRAVNRALRKAYGIGLCSVEELGSFSSAPKASLGVTRSNGSHNANGSNNGQPRLRDQLCLLIRQHNLDPTLVKAYATDFCGAVTLKEASREVVEAFISQLAAAARNDREALICKLNSYAQPAEAKP